MEPNRINGIRPAERLMTMRTVACLVLLVSLLVGFYSLGGIPQDGEGHFQLEMLPCWYAECCNHRYVVRDHEVLKDSLEKNVFGQHLVQDVVPGSIADHAVFKSQKPLVLSFHGTPGTGKNYVSQFIAQSWFEKGMESENVHLFSATKDFPLRSKLQHYQDILRKDIFSATKRCRYQIFIFDEIDSFPPYLLDSLSTFLDYHKHVDGVDFRDTIFIFLSNTGDQVLQQITTEHYLNNISREDIRFGSTEQALVNSVFSAEDTGFTRSRLVDSSLVSHYVPFLPLEKDHVRQCIRHEISIRYGGLGDREEVVEQVISELQFHGPDDKFSVKGCKNVPEKLNYVMSARRFRKKRV